MPFTNTKATFNHNISPPCLKDGFKHSFSIFPFAPHLRAQTHVSIHDTSFPQNCLCPVSLRVFFLTTLNHLLLLASLIFGFFLLQLFLEGQLPRVASWLCVDNGVWWVPFNEAASWRPVRRQIHQTTCLLAQLRSRASHISFYSC